MPAYIDEKNVALFSRFGILTPEEMHARYEIHLENYCKVTAIEAATLRDMTCLLYTSVVKIVPETVTGKSYAAAEKEPHGCGGHH